MLTKKQSELLRFIHERLQESGVPPSFDEMKDALDLRSKSGIHRLIMALEERGFIRRLANRARAIEVLRLPELATVAAPRAQKFSPSVIAGNLGRIRPMSGAREMRGQPGDGADDGPHRRRHADLRHPDPHDTIAMPPDFLGSGEHFALEVRGDSMIEAGIFENDTVIIRKQDTAETGDIVVALIDDEEATLKRLRKRGASIALEAANPAYETRIFGPTACRFRARWSVCSENTERKGGRLGATLRRPLLVAPRPADPTGPRRCGGPGRPRRVLRELSFESLADSRYFCASRLQRSKAVSTLETFCLPKQDWLRLGARGRPRLWT